MRLVLSALFILSCSSVALAQNSAQLQMQLATDPAFIQRVAYLMAQQAIVVTGEGTTPSACSGITTPTGVPCHTLRDNFAHQVLQSPIGTAQGSTIAIAGGVNLTTVTTTCTTNAQTNQTTCTSAATDAAIASQIATFWNALSGAQ